MTRRPRPSIKNSSRGYHLSLRAFGGLSFGQIVWIGFVEFAEFVCGAIGVMLFLAVDLGTMRFRCEGETAIAA